MKKDAENDFKIFLKEIFKIFVQKASFFTYGYEGIFFQSYWLKDKYCQ